MQYEPKTIEPKWQKKWEEEKLYQTKDNSGKPKFYALDMFPYPSGQGLHVGHPKGYIATDVMSRYKMLNGYETLHPMGWDAFGLPAENYALKNKIHPQAAVEENIKRFKEQLEKIGFTYDWSREINTTDPGYYKWTQWIFRELFKRGLVYESYAPINWCPSCKTGLANEDLEDGKCERCGSQVEKKPMRQWVLKITAYADRLLEDLKSLDWEPEIIEQQKNWIGRSEGALIKFKISNLKFQKGVEYLEVFTTRPDTLYGATYMVVAPEHEIIEKYKDAIENYDEVEEYIKEAQRKSEMERADLTREKTGVELKGIKAMNPANNEEIPIFAADYVLSGYGTGAIMAVPAHDERDFEFAKKYNLPIREVVMPIFGEERKDSEYRETITAVVQRKSDGKFLFLKWKEFGWISPSVGGIDKGESPEDAAEREVLEETGYKAKAIEKLGEKIEYHFYAENKKVWRWRVDQPVLLELLDETPGSVNEEEIKRHEVVWLTYEEAQKLNTHPENFIGFERWVTGPKAFTEKGRALNSEIINGLRTDEAKEKMIAWLEKNGLGKRMINYKMRDWVFARQRYWGEPFPLVFCENCAEKIKSLSRAESRDQKYALSLPNGSKIKNNDFSEGEILNPGWIIVPKEELPVTLPEVESYEPTGTGESPLANISSWVATTCPKCGGRAKRETNTMPQWAGSSWYYLRYIDPHNDAQLVDKEKEKYWMPVDLYVGGAEHATRHLLYARFWHKFLYDIGVVSTLEPFKKLLHVGLILAEDGRKMSKRYGNVVNPDEMIAKYGADSLRLYEMFMGPFNQQIAWNTSGLVGVRKFLDKVWKLQERIMNHESRIMEKNSAVGANSQSDINSASDVETRFIASENAENKKIKSLLHKTIKKVSEDIEQFKFNTAISSMMILINEMEKENEIDIENYKSLILILAPFAPHMCEELWSLHTPNPSAVAKAMADKSQEGNSSIFSQAWPNYDPELAKDENVELVVQINGKVRDKFEAPAEISEIDAKNLAMAREKIQEWIKGKEIVKIIFVKGKLINIVIK